MSIHIELVSIVVRRQGWEFAIAAEQGCSGTLLPFTFGNNLT
jgi:hypothetical protein